MVFSGLVALTQAIEVEFYFRSESVDPTRQNSYCTEVGVTWWLVAEWQLEADERLTDNITFQYIENDVALDMASISVNHENVTTYNSYGDREIFIFSTEPLDSARATVTLSFNRTYGIDGYGNTEPTADASEFRVVFYYISVLQNAVNRMKRNAGATAGYAGDSTDTSAADTTAADTEAADTTADDTEAAGTTAADTAAANTMSHMISYTTAAASDSVATDATASDATTDNMFHLAAAGIAVAVVQDANSTNNGIEDESDITTTEAQEFDITTTEAMAYHKDFSSTEFSDFTSVPAAAMASTSDDTGLVTTAVWSQDDDSVRTHTANLTIRQAVGEYHSKFLQCSSFIVHSNFIEVYPENPSLYKFVRFLSKYCH